MENRLETSQNPVRVQLGCGTLLIIAIIVMIFSGDRDERKTRKAIEELTAKVERLETKIDALNARLGEKSAASSPPANAAPPAGTATPASPAP